MAWNDASRLGGFCRRVGAIAALAGCAWAALPGCADPSADEVLAAALLGRWNDHAFKTHTRWGDRSRSAVTFRADGTAFMIRYVGEDPPQVLAENGSYVLHGDRLSCSLIDGGRPAAATVKGDALVLRLADGRLWRFRRPKPAE